jgi:hypothetical protein
LDPERRGIFTTLIVLIPKRGSISGFASFGIRGGAAGNGGFSEVFADLGEGRRSMAARVT